MVLLIPQYLTVIDLPILTWNLLNTPWAIWLPAVANGFNIFLLKRFFDSIPRELLGPPQIDGAWPLRILWSIVLPVSRPILGVVSIFAVVAVWKDFLWPLLVMPDTEQDDRSASASVADSPAQVRRTCVIAGAGDRRASRRSSSSS